MFDRIVVLLHLFCRVAFTLLFLVSWGIVLYLLLDVPGAYFHGIILVVVVPIALFIPHYMLIRKLRNVQQRNC